MSEKRDAPLAKIWKRTKEKAPRQKVIASTIHTVRKSKPATQDAARTALVAEAARQGVTDLSEKELKLMIDGSVTSAKDAASQAMTSSVAGVRSLWSNLQSSAPEWVELPDDVAGLNLRSEQGKVQVPVQVDSPQVFERLLAELPERNGVRTVNCWLSLDQSVTVVAVGKMRLGWVDATAAAPVFDVLARRRAWTPAEIRAGVLTIELPERP